MSKKDKNEARARRKKSIRKRIAGTEERPRLSVYRSNKHIYAQVIDDTDSRSILLVSDLTKALAAELEAAKAAPAETQETEEGTSPDGAKMRRARVVGTAVAKACLDKGIKKVVFDRNGYLYHGRVRALAEAARAAGLDF
ncbi:LSU ribosomal protein L18p (L5e) [Enhygromyxa salina]|uniref:Large ribosomal subunit protein uL18 n=1 Tax=Enhygromyxa salina TaxID=215803 RepID=A0A0C2D6W5_9BACT|nr:50S ribosomal protein L18 [Enhygromyxa salina]KIG15757.1 LSU ribosomal protein L18p (L5e) [Enhygromyxa salina]